jgi:hypothetical protein
LANLASKIKKDWLWRHWPKFLHILAIFCFFYFTVWLRIIKYLNQQKMCYPGTPDYQIVLYFVLADLIFTQPNQHLETQHLTSWTSPLFRVPCGWIFQRSNLTPPALILGSRFVRGCTEQCGLRLAGRL